MQEAVHPVVWAAVALLVAIEALLQVAGGGSAGFVPFCQFPGVAEVSLHDQAVCRLAVGAIPPDMALHVPDALPWFLGGLVGHALLHAGWVHLAFNAVGLLCLGHVVRAQSGTGAFVATLLITAVAGAIAFLLMAPANSIMVGASGAVFGLLGVVLRWRASRVALWRVLLVLALLALPAGFIFGAAIAWQAHLGGFLAGWLLGSILRIRRRIIHPLM